ncbi:MAG: tRNA (adenosine(37)-N6)-threonylcarbamoyltransferase complex ATPase subunit type 1 TsaE [Oscillospiraceae bacterium]|nr:tRNA (adenosine(37)-N6)-threonylcarbamoyltransferase complex ATPase subunit type 1 TsaE [Oscillospiraceae bacterium]
MTTAISNSPAETHEIAKQLGKTLRKGDCVAMLGNMGAGKTTFTRGLCEGIGLPDMVSSPTFALVNEYHAEGCISVYHFDMYRVTSPEALESTGFWDYPLSDGIFVIEWAENIMDSLPENCIRVTLTGSGDEPRTVTVERSEEHDPCN